MMRRFGPPSFAARAAVLVLVLATVSSCGTGNPAGTSSSASAPRPAPAPAATASPPSSAKSLATDCVTGGWRPAPVSVTRQVAVPPVPVITAIRTATRPGCGYDRIVVDFTGPAPGYHIRYVTHVTADPSGKPVTVPGHSYLLITLRPAQAHTDAGSPAITRHVQALRYPMLRGYALAGDFEGVLTLALGLQDRTSIRVGELPGRLYIDVKI